MVQDVVYIELTGKEREVVEAIRKIQYGKVTVYIEASKPIRITEEKNIRL